MAIRLHYFRAARQVSSEHVRGVKTIGAVTCLAGSGCPRSLAFGDRGQHRASATAACLLLAACGVLLAPSPAIAQYVGQVAKNKKDNPELRAVAVLEWTGEAGKPKACRVVPVTVLDQGELQDGGIYLARPQPLALAGEVEYQLQQDGKTIGLFDIENSGMEQGSWVGYGKWKPVPTATPEPPKLDLAQIDEDDDKPVLHRKKHLDDPSAAGSGSGSPSASPSGGTSSGGSGSASNGPTPDPDRPTLHKASPNSQPSAGSSGSGNQADDPDRPHLKKDKKKEPDPLGNVESLPGATDPDRPRLKRGKSADYLAVVPSLMGLPPDMKQAVAVSDAKDRPDHPWDYTWANPADEAKMKAALEDVARDALGLTPPPPAPAPKKTSASARKKAAPPPPPPPAPLPLTDEQFRTFELAYGAGATLVLSAHTDGPLAQEKFVTIVAQPDLYGNALILLKHVTDGDHLDENPRMRLVDAVDALADNRGELLFELRGNTLRQFALYRVLRGRAEKLFVSGGGEFGTASN